MMTPVPNFNNFCALSNFYLKHCFLHFYSKNAFSKRKLLVFPNTLELDILERHVFRPKIVQF